MEFSRGKFSSSKGRYASFVAAGKCFTSYATVTAPVIFTTAAGTGGPLLYNPSTSGKNAYILRVGFSSSVVTTVAGGLGFTGAGGQTAAPSSTTAIDKTGNCLIGSAVTSACTTYRVGTPTNAGTTFTPFAQFHTGALTVDTTGQNWVEVDGSFVVPPGSWFSVAGSATLSTLVVGVSLIWAELNT
jgi:hypothetical protein